MTAPSFVDRDTFLANLRASGLVNKAQLKTALAQIPATNRGRVIARALVEQGVLTRFQAERLLVGRTSGFLLGQYRILDQLGRGGMGRVFKAQHVTMDRIVALKVLAPALLETARARELFLHEVRAVAQLVHPNIVAAYDANEVGDRFYLVLEYVDGPNLEQLVRKQGPLPISQACDYMRQAATGLQCAHMKGMLHRDIKPANILVQRRGLDPQSPGLVKISDFGLARLQVPDAPGGGTILTRANTVMGTPDYLSPEQARNLHRTDIRSDLYSLGCTFYFLLTGRVPFPGGTALEKLVRHGTEKPAPVTDLRPDVHAPVAAIVHRLMDKHPDDRFQTPAELAEALAPYAVSGTTPWAPLWSPTGGSNDTIPAADSIADSSDDLDSATGSSDLSALANTVAPGLSPTPLADDHPVIRRRRPPRRRRSWPTVAVILAALVAIVVFLLMHYGIF
jgi:serine/threonine protein kinase